MNRITIMVEVNLDPIYGPFHSEEDACMRVARILEQHIGHYKPTAVLAPQNEGYVDRAVLIDEEAIKPGGKFFMNDEAVVGYFCIRSTDPDKRDLFLPAHIFNKCFEFYNEGDHVMMPDVFCLVRELI